MSERRGADCCAADASAEAVEDEKGRTRVKHYSMRNYFHVYDQLMLCHMRRVINEQVHV
jgi:hypothetical protein